MPVNVQRQEAGWSQDKQRSLAIFFDQHRNERLGFPFGRPWWCHVENPADPGAQRRPVGELLPVSVDTVVDGIVLKGWNAPWLPEPKYIAHATSWMAGNRFRLNYQQMIQEYRAANESYYHRAAAESAARNWSHEIRLYGPLSFQVLAIVGNPPKSPKLPEAALAEDPWLLGFAKEPNERLLSILLKEQGRFAGVTYEEAGLDETGKDPNAPEPKRVQIAVGALPAALSVEAEVKQRPEINPVLMAERPEGLSATLSTDEIMAAIHAAEIAKVRREQAKKASTAASERRKQRQLVNAAAGDGPAE